MTTMTVQITCAQCGSGIHIYPSVEANLAECEICSHTQEVHFTSEHEQGILKECPCCTRKDFYVQKDFNRKIGVSLFVLASILAIFTYGISFIVLYAVDFFLFKKLKYIVICYQCGTIFRHVNNFKEIGEFDHEMHDRIVYSGHDFKGKPLSH